MAAKSLIRTLGFFSQWSAEVARQPWLMATLVLGPFIVLLLFGEGVKIGAPKPRAIFVSPAGQSAANNPLMPTPQELNQYLRLVGTTSSEQDARQSLAQGDADVVVVFPANPMAAINKGEHPQIQVLTNEIDPVKQSYATAYINDQVGLLNQSVVRKVVQQTQASAGDIPSEVSQAQRFLALAKAAQSNTTAARAYLDQLKSALSPVKSTLDQTASQLQRVPLFGIVGLTAPLDQLRAAQQSVDNLTAQLNVVEQQLTQLTGSVSPQDLDRIQNQLDELNRQAVQLRNVPPDVASAPFTAKIMNVAPFIPTSVGFYAPAVLMLLLQHAGVTLGALTMARVRLLGLMELFQTSPLRPREMAIGNYLSYGTLSCLIGGALVALMVLVLGVPVFGSASALAGVLLLLIVAALGIGFVISLLSSSEQQAAQAAMLVLIGSVFFSGFLVSLDMVDWPVRFVSYLLPATYAIRTGQDVMLRGTLRQPSDIAILAGFAAFFFATTILLLRREFRPR